MENDLIGLIKKFDNGEELYKKSPLFNQVINLLCNGVTYYDIINSLIGIIENNNKIFKDYVEKDVRPFVLTNREYINSVKT